MFKQKLLDGSPPREAYLSVGNLVNKFCRTHGCESNEIKSITDKFVTKLGDCKNDNKNRKKENQIIAIIKGIRNMNNLQSPALEKIIDCATNNKNSKRIRINAIQTFSAAACNEKMHSTALNLFKNINEDSEIRIEAYLSLTKCPNSNIANEIELQLNNELVYQVGSFVTTHLRNLRSTTDISRQLAKQYFSNIQINKKFPNDIRKYSFNNEFSYDLDKFGVGASVDTNVIYSQNEFLPRSTSFNLTGEIFGKSFNLFELSARQENMDLLFEHYFGPKGLLRTTNVEEFYSLFKNLNNNDGDTDKHNRNQRSIKDDLQSFRKTIQNDNNEKLNDIDYDISFKFFGTEMYFLSLDDEQHLSFEPKDFLKRMQNCWEKMLTNANGFNEKYENHALFMDADLVYPTGIGLPLKLGIQGTSVVRLETSGKINFEKIVKDPKNTKFTLKMVPR